MWNNRRSWIAEFSLFNGQKSKIRKTLKFSTTVMYLKKNNKNLNANRLTLIFFSSCDSKFTFFCPSRQTSQYSVTQVIQTKNLQNYPCISCTWVKNETYLIIIISTCNQNLQKILWSSDSFWTVFPGTVGNDQEQLSYKYNKSNCLLSNGQICNKD